MVEAARIRIQNIFDTGLEIEMSTSGGKDSICMMHLVYTLIREGKIKAKQLVVRFIDEEAIFDDVERIVMDWRKRFLKAGVRFEWFCVQTVHFNCLRTLEDNDSFVLWDEWERDQIGFPGKIVEIMQGIYSPMTKREKALALRKRLLSVGREGN